MEHLCASKAVVSCCIHTYIRMHASNNVSFERNSFLSFLPEDMSCGGGAAGILLYLLLLFTTPHLGMNDEDEEITL